MMDLIPISIDGAVVFNLQNSCTHQGHNCEHCTQLILTVHNWIKVANLDYAVMDLLDEKDICPTFLTELLQLRKRLKLPFLFSGVMDRPRKYLEGVNYDKSYPTFITPEDAVRALRIQHPGITESPLKIPIKWGQSLLQCWKQNVAEPMGIL